VSSPPENNHSNVIVPRLYACLIQPKILLVGLYYLFLLKLSSLSSSSSSSFPVLGLLTPVTGFTKLNHSIFSKVCLSFFSLLVGILEYFFWILSNNIYALERILMPVISGKKKIEH
jgi:hypothetical protein